MSPRARSNRKNQARLEQLASSAFADHGERGLGKNLADFMKCQQGEVGALGFGKASDGKKAWWRRTVVGIRK